MEKLIFCRDLMLQSRAIFRSDFRYGYEEGKSLEKIAFVNLENLRCGGCFFYDFFREYFHDNLRIFCSISAVLHQNVCHFVKKGVWPFSNGLFGAMKKWGRGNLKMTLKGVGTKELILSWHQHVVLRTASIFVVKRLKMVRLLKKSPSYRAF